MSEQHLDEPQLPLLGTGQRLKAAREAAGLSRADMAARTRISERIIALIEAGDFAALPSRTYAIGFARSYAKVLGLDGEAYAASVREEMGLRAATEAGELPAYEPGDPARVPTARFAWIAALLALVVVAAGLVFWRSYYAPAVSLPSALPVESPLPPPPPAPPPVPQIVSSAPAVDASGMALPTAAATAAPVAAATTLPAARSQNRPVVRHSSRTPADSASPVLTPAPTRVLTPVPTASGTSATSTVTN